MKVLNPTIDLLNGRLGVEDWHNRIKPLIVSLHFANAATALQGQLSAHTWPHLFRVVSRELGILRSLAAEFAADPQSVIAQPVDQEGVHPFMAQVSLLIDMSRCTYENLKMWRNHENGHAFARRVMSSMECSTRCIRESQKEWLPVSDIVPLGADNNRVECRCVIITSRAPY